MLEKIHEKIKQGTHKMIKNKENWPIMAKKTKQLVVQRKTYSTQMSQQDKLSPKKTIRRTIDWKHQISWSLTKSRPKSRRILANQHQSSQVTPKKMIIAEERSKRCTRRPASLILSCWVSGPWSIQIYNSYRIRILSKTSRWTNTIQTTRANPIFSEVVKPRTVSSTWWARKHLATNRLTRTSSPMPRSDQ